MSFTRIFLLDEQNLFRESFALLLGKSDVLTLAGQANSLENANQLLSREAVDVLLASATLPEINAYHGIRLLRARFPLIRVALLDNYFVAVHIRQAIRSGALGYFTRRDQLETLEVGLQQVAQGKRAFTPECSELTFAEPETSSLSSSASHSQLGLLSARELEILRYLAEGLSVRQSAEKLQLAPSTVDNHKSRLMRKLNVHKSIELTRIAIREGLVST